MGVAIRPVLPDMGAGVGRLQREESRVADLIGSTVVSRLRAFGRIAVREAPPFAHRLVVPGTGPCHFRALGQSSFQGRLGFDERRLGFVGQGRLSTQDGLLPRGETASAVSSMVRESGLGENQGGIL
ncbi:hypothetical protein EON81_20495 [bacterium]|nr:MAG: hypothetical protein EON81_20495 [bacterium]